MRATTTRVLVAVLAALVLVGCGDARSLPAVSLAGRGGWVIVVWMSGDNELERQAIEDVNEMEAAGLAGSGVTVLVLLDRAEGHDASNGDWTGTRLYEIVDDPDGLDGEIKSLPVAVPSLGIDPASGDVELDMADPRTLAGLLDYVAQTYEPDRTALVVWGHGSGFRGAPAAEAVAGGPSRRATSFDDASAGDALYTAELAEALVGRSLDVVGFDTCYAGSLEVAWELRESASYLVASQDAVPADGWEYDDLLARFLTTDRSPESLARSMAESYASVSSGFANAAVAAIRLDRIRAVMDALNAVSLEVYRRIDSREARDRIRASLFYDVEDFYSTPGDLALDLGDLGRVIARDYDLADREAEALVAAVSDAVIFNAAGAANPRASGISVHYVPLRADGTPEASHDPAYYRGGDVAHPLSFVVDSDWVPIAPDGPGLLHRLFYEEF